MKILILNGSPRKKGVSSQILNRLEEQASQFGEVDHIRVYDKDIAPCIGCLACRPDKECKLPLDDGQKIARMIKDADFLVLGSPTYWGNMTGPLKTLIDRCVTSFEYLDGHSIPKKLLKGKKALICTVSNAPVLYNQLPSQSRGAVRSMKTVLKAGGCNIRGVLNIADSSNFQKYERKVYKRVDRLVKLCLK